MMNKRKGFFLVFSLGILIVLSLFCIGLGFRTYIQTRKTKLFLNKQRAFYLAVSGVKTAAQVIYKDIDLDVDHLAEDWAQAIEEKVAFTYPQKEGVVSIKIEDELCRLNINTLDRKILAKLLAQRDVDDADVKAEYIADYIDVDAQPQGGESEFEGKVKNSRLSVVEELLLVQNIAVEDYDKVKDFITAIGGDKVNINTASREMVDFLIDDSFPGKADILKKRFGGDGDEPGYYSVSEWNEVSDGTISSEPAVLLKNMFCINSQYFRIISEADIEGVKKKITCLWSRNSGKILYWYES